MIPIWKKEKPELKTVHFHTLQDVTMRFDLALQAFFRRVKAGDKAGYPRFKGKGWYDSITYRSCPETFRSKSDLNLLT